jgi:allophanate hydrolase subunit 1
VDPLELRPVGRDAVLAEVRDSAAARSLAAYARAARVTADEVVPGARTVLFDGVPDPEGLRERLAGWTAEVSAEPGALVEVPVTYDGADLDDVAARWGTDVEGVVERHGGIEFVSAARAVRRAAARQPAHQGAGRLGRPGRVVVRRLPV